VVLTSRFNRTFANRPGEPIYALLMGYFMHRRTIVSIAPLRTGPANRSPQVVVPPGKHCFNRTFANRPGEPTEEQKVAIREIVKFQSHLCEPARRTYADDVLQ